MKRALITGSARGIGRAIAIQLARDGYAVIISATGLSAQALETKAVIEQNGGQAEIVPVDLCDPDQTRAFAEKMGKVDVLILNASVQYRRKWDEIPLEECMKQLNCNFVSSLLLIQAAVPHMKEQGWGRIVTVGSVQEVKPHPDMLIYSASKAAQTNMVHSLALQLAPSGITVNNVAPGVIYTDRNKEVLADAEYAKIVTDTIPLGFYGEPEDLAGMVSLLCSEKGRYITGQSIYVDGGKGIQ